MRSDVSTARVRALDEAPAGQEVRIRAILFEGLRAECARLGVREGGVFRVGTRAGSHLRLESADGRAPTLRWEWARFIEVEPLPGPGALWPGSGPAAGPRSSATA